MAPMPGRLVPRSYGQTRRRYDTYATAAGDGQGLQALSPRHWPPLGAFIKLPALRVVHDFTSETIIFTLTRLTRKISFRSGRGVRPTWLAALETRGHNREEFRVEE
jgi:hypothetical protein